MIAPRESRVQIEPIISTLEYTETPKVATKKLKPLVRIERMQVLCAMRTASVMLLPLYLSVVYRFVISIA